MKEWHIHSDYNFNGLLELYVCNAHKFCLEDAI